MRYALVMLAMFSAVPAFAEPAEYEQNLIDTFVISFLVSKQCPELVLDPKTNAILIDEVAKRGDVFSLSGRNGKYINDKIDEFSAGFRSNRQASCYLALKYFGPDNPKGTIIVRKK